MHTNSQNTDSRIFSSYSADVLERKLQNKLAFQEELGWPPEEKRAMLSLPIGMSDGHGRSLFTAVLPGILALPIELLICGKRVAKFGKAVSHLITQASHRIAIVPYENTAAQKMYAAADMVLFLAKPLPAELSLCLQCGTIPIAPAVDTLENYNPNQERGCAFLYETPSPWQCFAALVRALETYRFPFDWRNIQRTAMRIV